MKEHKLTPRQPTATKRLTRGKGRTGEVSMVKAFRPGLMAIALSGALAGCINIAAPEEPIVIELNVNIRAEVLYRLAEDASNTIDENADIF